LPEITLIVNLGLLATLDWLSLFFGLQLAIIGGLVFFFYSRKRVVRQETGLHLPLAESEPGFQLRSGERILMPVANPETQQSIFELCNALLSEKGGEVVALHIVNTPEQVDFRTALANSERSLELLERMEYWKTDERVKIRPVVRASHKLGLGIVHAAEEERCDLIVMGYTGKRSSTASANLMELVLNRSSVNCILLKLK